MEITKTLEERDSDRKPTGLNVCTKGETMKMTKEQLMGEFIPTLMNAIPKMSAFKALREFCKTTCPKGLGDSELINAIEMEAFCRDYHVAPFGTDMGYLDYPRRVVDAFGIISIARERTKSEEHERMMKKKDK